MMRLLRLGAAFLLIASLLTGCFTGAAEHANTVSTPIDNASAKNDNASAKKDEPAATPNPAAADESMIGERIKVNQVGYLTNSPKLAVVTGDVTVANFQLYNIDNGKVSWTGHIGEGKLDTNSGDQVHLLDFSEWTTPGTYSITVKGAGTSYPFRIGDDVFRETLVKVGRSFTLQRAGVAVNDPVTGLVHEAGHTQDAKAQMSFSDAYHKEGDTLDVSGGWYDAGDYGKYISTATVSAAQMMLAYEFSPSKFTEGQLLFPKGLDQEQTKDKPLPDLLAEVKYELDWMLKMQRPDGAVYHKVSSASWPGFVKPEEDQAVRYVYGMSTYGTAQFAGTTAMAARIYAPLDASYSKRLLEAAVKAENYLEQHPQAEFITGSNQDSGSGAYRKNSDLEERFWAASELLRTTGNSKYEQIVEQNFTSFISSGSTDISWGNSVLLGQWAMYKSEKAPADVKNKVQTAVTSFADGLLRTIEQDGYLSVLQNGDYNWGSNRAAMGKAGVLLMANEMNPKPEYINGALEQLNVLLGRNATGYSYITGVGTRMPLHPHSRLMAGTKTYVPGVVVGGANKSGGDPAADKFLKGAQPPIPSGKSYLDVQDSYSTNEYAIDYTAAAFFVLAYFKQ